MKLTMDAAVLARELQFLRGAVETSTTIPILSHVLAEAEGAGLRLTATNLDMAIRGSCAARVTVSGALALPGSRFLGYVKLLAGDMTLTAEKDNWLRIVSGRSRARMAALSRDGWPELPAMPETDIEMGSQALAKMIARTEFAIAREESRFALDGGASHGSDVISLVATDGHRLAMVGPENKGKRILVPRKALAQAAKLAAAVEQTVKFAHEGNYLFFQFGNRLLISRELSGSFPDYQRVLPKDAAHTVELDRGALEGAIKRVAEFSDEGSRRAIRIELRPDELVISASVASVGESEESLPVKFAGAGVAIGFCAEYLLDFLRAVKCDRVLFSFTNGQGAGEFRPAGEDGYRYIVMPMRI